MAELLNVSANTTGETFNTNDGDRYNKRIAQVEITGTATVKLQGRVDSTLGWVDVNTYTASTCETVQLFPEMRAVSSGMSAATVKVHIDARKRIGG